MEHLFPKNAGVFSLQEDCDAREIPAQRRE